jgi:hypothetical protein
MAMAAYSGVCAATRSPLGEVVASAEARGLLRAAVDEVALVAMALDVPLTQSDADEAYDGLMCVHPRPRVRDSQLSRRCSPRSHTTTRRSKLGTNTPLSRRFSPHSHTTTRTATQQTGHQHAAVHAVAVP